MAISSTKTRVIIPWHRSRTPLRIDARPVAHRVRGPRNETLWRPWIGQLTARVGGPLSRWRRLRFRVDRSVQRPESNAGFFGSEPERAIPVLTDGDLALYEAAAINLHLVDKFHSDLLPAGYDRDLTLQWMFWAAEHWRQGPPCCSASASSRRLWVFPRTRS